MKKSDSNNNSKNNKITRKQLLIICIAAVIMIVISIYIEVEIIQPNLKGSQIHIVVNTIVYNHLDLTDSPTIIMTMVK